MLTTRMIAWIDTLPLHQTVSEISWIVPSVQRPRTPASGTLATAVTATAIRAPRSRLQAAGLAQFFGHSGSNNCCIRAVARSRAVAPALNLFGSGRTLDHRRSRDQPNVLVSSVANF